MSIGLFLVICLVVFLLVGLPIGFSLGLTAVSYFFYTDNLRYLIVLAQRTFNGINSFELIAIPLFILAGDLMYEGKISQALVNLAKSLAGSIRGSMPIIATLALWCGVGKWNDWMTGVLYMANRQELQLIQNYLRRMLIDASSTSTGGMGDTEIKNMAASVQMATIVVGTIPIILIYPFVQKYFVKGVILGSIKG